MDDPNILLALNSILDTLTLQAAQNQAPAGEGPAADASVSKNIIESPGTTFGTNKKEKSTLDATERKRIRLTTQEAYKYLQKQEGQGDTPAAKGDKEKKPSANLGQDKPRLTAEYTLFAKVFHKVTKKLSPDVKGKTKIAGGKGGKGGAGGGAGGGRGGSGKGGGGKGGGGEDDNFGVDDALAGWLALKVTKKIAGIAIRLGKAAVVAGAAGGSSIVNRLRGTPRPPTSGTPGRGGRIPRPGGPVRTLPPSRYAGPTADTPRARTPTTRTPTRSPGMGAGSGTRPTTPRVTPGTPAGQVGKNVVKETTKKVIKKTVAKTVLTTTGKVVAKTLAKFVPGVGWVLLAKDVWDIAAGGVKTQAEWNDMNKVADEVAGRSAKFAQGMKDEAKKKMAAGDPLGAMVEELRAKQMSMMQERDTKQHQYATEWGWFDGINRDEQAELDKMSARINEFAKKEVVPANDAWQKWRAEQGNEGGREYVAHHQKRMEKEAATSEKRTQYYMDQAAKGGTAAATAMASQRSDLERGQKLRETIALQKSMNAPAEPAVAGPAIPAPGQEAKPKVAEVAPPQATPMAKGGIVTSPTLALIGEAGPEAVIPLGDGKSEGLGVLKQISTGIQKLVSFAKPKPESQGKENLRTLVSKLFKPMATGGIVTKPTLALIGEDGPEAVIPVGKVGGMTSSATGWGVHDTAKAKAFLAKHEADKAKRKERMMRARRDAWNESHGIKKTLFITYDDDEAEEQPRQPEVDLTVSMEQSKRDFRAPANTAAALADAADKAKRKKEQMMRARRDAWNESHGIKKTLFITYDDDEAEEQTVSMEQSKRDFRAPANTAAALADEADKTKRKKEQMMRARRDAWKESQGIKKTLFITYDDDEADKKTQWDKVPTTKWASRTPSRTPRSIISDSSKSAPGASALRVGKTKPIPVRDQAIRISNISSITDEIKTSNSYLDVLVKLTKDLVKMSGGRKGDTIVPIPAKPSPPSESSVQGNPDGPTFTDGRVNWVNSDYSMHTPGMNA